MRVYLAAKFNEQELMKEWKQLLEENGHHVTSRWLDAAKVDLTNDYDAASIEARIDLIDIDTADAVISKTLTRGELFTGGGRCIEFGYALARGKVLINVGGKESVFHTFAKTVPTIADAIKLLNETSIKKI